MRNRLKTCLVGALLFAGSACSEPLAPESILGTYGLTTAIAPVETATHRHELLGIVVEIAADRLTRTAVTRTTELASGEAEVSVSEQEMVYRIDGARIVTSGVPCPLEMLCSAVLFSTPDYRVVPGGLIELGREGPTKAFARVTLDYDSFSPIRANVFPSPSK